MLLRGGHLRVDRSSILADTRGDVAGARLGIDLQVTADAIITNDSLIGSRPFALGDGGNIHVNVGHLTLTGGAQLSTSSQGSGRGGNVSVMASEALSITGANSGLFVNANASGDAGQLSISTPLLTMDDGFIQAVAVTGSQGNAGDIDVRVGRLTLSGSAQLSGSTRGSGRGGNVSVMASEALSITGANSGLFSRADGNGSGGSIHVQARKIELRDNGTISAGSSGAGDAGMILLQAGETFHSQNGAVTTQAARAGGGTIVLRAGRLVQLQDSEVTTSVRGGGGDAGNLTLDAPSIVSRGSQLIANAFAGMGGNIRIEAEVFLADPASRVSASSTLGISGIVDIRAPVTNLVGTLAPLPQTFVDVAELLPARCAARFSGGTVSSLVLGGREGLPLDPGGLLPSPLTLDERLIVDPGVTAGPHQQPSTTKFALLMGADKAFPRLRGNQWAGRCPKAM